MSGEFAVKINEIWGGGSWAGVAKELGDKLAGGKGYKQPEARPSYGYEAIDPNPNEIFTVNYKNKEYFKDSDGTWWNKPVTNDENLFSREIKADKEVKDILDRYVVSGDYDKINVEQQGQDFVAEPTANQEPAADPAPAAPTQPTPAPAAPAPSDALQGKHLPTMVRLPSGKEGIKFQGKVFTLNDQGQWQYFGSNKPVPKDLQDEFDAVIGFNNSEEPAPAPAAPTPAAAPAPAAPTPAAAPAPAPQRGPRPIVVKGASGDEYRYNDADRKWYQDGQEVTDPGSLQKLRQAAEVQFQNRAMSVHESIDLGQVLWNKMKRVD